MIYLTSTKLRRLHTVGWAVLHGRGCRRRDLVVRAIATLSSSASPLFSSALILSKPKKVIGKGMIGIARHQATKIAARKTERIGRKTDKKAGNTIAKKGG